MLADQALSQAQSVMDDLKHTLRQTLDIKHTTIQFECESCGQGPVVRVNGGEKIMSKVSVVLDEQQQNEIRMILVDEDAQAALRFLKRVIWKQVQAVERKELRSHLDEGQA